MPGIKQLDLIVKITNLLSFFIGLGIMIVDLKTDISVAVFFLAVALMISGLLNIIDDFFWGLSS